MPTQLFRLVSHSWRSDVRLHTMRHGRNGESYGRNNRLSRKNWSWGWESCKRPMRTNRESWRPWGRSVMFYNNSCWASYKCLSQPFYWKSHVLFILHFKFNSYLILLLCEKKQNDNPHKTSPCLENLTTAMGLVERPVFSHTYGMATQHFAFKMKR